METQQITVTMQMPITVSVEGTTILIKVGDVLTPMQVVTTAIPAAPPPAPPGPPAPEVLEQARTRRAQGEAWETIIPALFTWTPGRRKRGSTPEPLGPSAGVIYRRKVAQLKAALGEVDDPPADAEHSA